MARKVKGRALKKKKLTPRQRSRLGKDKRLEQMLIWGVVAVAVAVVGVLGYGIVTEKILKPREPVAVVGDTPITTAEFQSRVRFRRLQMRNQLNYMYQQQQQMASQGEQGQTFQQYLQGQIEQLQSQLASENAATIGEQTLDQMVQEELIRQEAERRGISVASEQVQEEIQSSFGYEPDATPVPTAAPPVTSTESLTEPASTPLPTPTKMTEADFRQMYNRYMREGLKPLSISEQSYRSWIEVSLLREKLLEAMKEEEVPAEAEQVNLNILTVQSEEKANELAARLDEGEDFQALADELSEAEDAPGYANETGWLPREMLVSRLGEDLADQAFNMEVGEHSGPVTVQEGQQYQILQVTGHEVRALEDTVRQRMAQDVFQTWLDAQQTMVERKSYRDRVPTEP